MGNVRQVVKMAGSILPHGARGSGIYWQVWGLLDRSGVFHLFGLLYVDREMSHSSSLVLSHSLALSLSLRFLLIDTLSGQTGT